MQDRTTQSRLLYLGVIAAAYLFAIGRSGPLNGTLPALLIIVIGQIYLPGWLLNRALRLKTQDHPVSQFAWTLASGLSATIVLAGLFRLLSLPVEAYVTALHAVMAALALASPPVQPQVNWSILRSSPLSYAILALLCLIGLQVGIDRSQLEYSGWEDQTVFISAASWLANDPVDPQLPSRQVSALVVERARWVTDGWTYQHAVWEWATGIPTSRIIWHLVTPLFSWTTPLLTFALAYTLVRNERLALLCAASFTLTSLLTLDHLVYTPTALAFGYNHFAQMNTLRLFSSAVMLPLAQMVCIAAANEARRGVLLLAFLAAVTLAVLHPRQITILAITMGAFCTGQWFAVRIWKSSLIVMAIITTALLIPYAQRALLEAASPTFATSMSRAEQAFDGQGNSETGSPGLVNIGERIIADPREVFYHPVIALAAGLGLLLPLWSWQRVESRFAFGASLAMILLLFTPYLTELFVRVVTPRITVSFMLMLPVGLILGITLDGLANRLGRFRLIPVLAMMALILWIAYEPLPLFASAPDQNRAANEVQAQRDIRPADAALIKLLKTDTRFDLDAPTVFLTPNRIANYVVENVPRSLVVGGRASENPLVVRQVDRFFEEGDSFQPFLDRNDHEFFAQWNVEFVIAPTDAARAAQMLMEPGRFQLIARQDGYIILRVLTDQTQEADRLFEQMNDVIASVGGARWKSDGFSLEEPGSPMWQDLVKTWQIQVDQDNENPTQRYGLAASLLLAGNDAETLPHWQWLHDHYPTNLLFAQALAHTLRSLQQGDAGVAILARLLTSSEAGERAVAARTLLSPTFFYLLNTEHLSALAAAVEQSPTPWDLLAGYDRPDDVRAYSALLLSAGYARLADTLLAGLPAPQTRPEDLWTRAQIRLAQDDVDGALRLLEPYLNADTYASANLIHPDRWHINSAAGLYHLLRGDLAARRGDVQTAAAHYQQAIPQGFQAAGSYFAALVLGAQGQAEEARAFLLQLENHETPHSALASALGLGQLEPGNGSIVQQINSALPPGLTAAASNRIPAFRSLLDMPTDFQPGILRVTWDENVQIHALFSQPSSAPFPILSWNVSVFHPDTFESYGYAEFPAQYIPGALSEWHLEVPLENVEVERIGVMVQAAHNALVRFPAAYAFADAPTR